MLQLYGATELEFKKNGETLSKAFNAKLTHYLNGEYSLEFYLKQSDPKSKLVEVDKIIFAEGQPFRVVMITPGIKDIHVYAVHVFFDLRDYQVEAVNCDQTNGYTVMQAIFNGAGTNFTYLSDITKLSTMNEEKKNIIEMLQIASERYEGELVRNKFDVRLNNRVGVDTEHIVYVDKNVATAIKEVDVKDVCTRAIIEYGSHDEPKRVIVTSENINLYSHPKTRRYQNITDDIQTEQQAIDWGLGKFKGINRIDVPKVAVEIDLLLDDSLKDLQIGDTVICKIPNLFLDERVKVIGYESDPLKQEKTKLYIGYKPKGLGGSIIGGAVEAIRPEIADVDKDLQAKIDAANAAIDKEYNDRVQAVTDAIAKAEADVEKAKEELNQELGQAMIDWDTTFDKTKTQIDNSISNVEKELDIKITANSELIEISKGKVDLIVADGSSASAIQLTPNGLLAIAEQIDLKGNVVFSSLVEGDGTSTQILGGKIKTNTIKTSTLLVDKEILVNGTIKAIHLDGATANLSQITSLLHKTEVLDAAWANIGNAIITKLTADDAFFQKLTAKSAWITSANIVSLEASRIKTGMLQSTNGRFKIDLDNAWLKAYATTGNPYITINQDAVTLHNPNSTAGAAWGQLFAQNSRMTLRSRGDSSGLSLGYDSGGGYVEGIYLASSGVAYHKNQTNFAARVYAQSDLFQHRNGSHGGTMMISSSTEHSVKPTGANQGAIGTSGNYWNNSWVANRNNPSSLEFKHISHYLNDSESLNLVKNVGVARYFYKGDEFVSKNSQTGLIYEDVRDQPQRDLLTNEEDKAINIYNMNSVLWSATREIDKTQTEQFEYVNEEIAILWKAVQELSAQINELKGA